MCWNWYLWTRSEHFSIDVWVYIAIYRDARFYDISRSMANGDERLHVKDISSRYDDVAIWWIIKMWQGDRKLHHSVSARKRHQHKHTSIICWWLASDYRTRCMGRCLLQCIITGNATWVNHVTPVTRKYPWPGNTCLTIKNKRNKGYQEGTAWQLSLGS